MVKFVSLLVALVAMVYDVFPVAIYVIWHYMHHFCLYISKEICINGTASMKEISLPYVLLCLGKQWYMPYVHLMHILLLPPWYH